MKKMFLTAMCFGMALTGFAQTSKLPAPDVSSAPQKATQFHSPWTKKANATTTQHKANYVLSEIVPDGENMVYAFTPYDYEKWSYNHTFFKFRTDKPYKDNWTRVRDFDNRKMEDWMPVIMAQTFVGDELWAVTKRPFDMGYFYMEGIFQMDLEDGKLTPAGGDLRYRLYNSDDPDQRLDDAKYADYNAPMIVDMSYDPTTGLLWYVAPELRGTICWDSFSRAAGWNIGYFDTKLDKPEAVKLITIPCDFTKIGDEPSEDVTLFGNIVADHGKLYTITNHPYYNGIDEEDGSKLLSSASTYYIITPDVNTGDYTMDEIKAYDPAEELQHIPADIFGWSSLEMDRDNRVLYFTYSDINDYQPYWSKIDIETGEIISTELQGGQQLSLNGLAIPYQVVPDNSPANVTNLHLTAGINGNPSVSLSWTLPTGSYLDRSKNPEITEIHIYRGEELVATLDGDAEEYIDTEVPYGEYKYTVVAANAAGEGLREARSTFVGRDVPGNPGNVVLTAEEANATLTWTAPATGLHNGWYDNASLAYNVVRMPDNVTVATGLTETTFTETVTKTAGYSYVVTATNHEGVGGSTTSNLVSFGPELAVPFTHDFRDESIFKMWTVLDYNQDGFTWKYDWYHNGHDRNPEDGKCPIYDACANKPADYFISPAIATETGKQYKITYTWMNHNYIKNTDITNPIPTVEHLGWYNGDVSDMPGEGELTCFCESEISSQIGLKWHTFQGVFTATSDRQHIMASDLSPANEGIAYLKGVTVREYSEKDLAVTKVSGSVIANAGRELPINVTIKNEGNKLVRNFKVVVYDENNESIAEQEFEQRIGSEESATVTVNWTSPTSTGLHHVYAKVLLDGDTYEEDNVVANPLDITVSKLESDFRTVGNIDMYHTNWINVSYPTSLSQALYRADELQLEKGKMITAVGFLYEGHPGLAKFRNVEFDVSLGNSTLDKIYDYYKFAADYSYYPRFLPGSYFEDASFFGSVPFNATSGYGQLLFPLDEPLIYDGDNIIIQVIRTESTLVTDEGYSPCFAFQSLDNHFEIDEIEDYDGRAMFKGSQTEIPTTGTTGVAVGSGLNNLPVLIIGYKDAPEGIEGVKTLAGNLNVDAREGVLYLDRVCTDITVTDLQGRTVAKVAKGQTIQLPAGVNGACVLNATLANGQAVNLKVTL